MLAPRKRMVVSLAGSVAGVLCLAMSMPAGAADGIPIVGPALPDIPIPSEISGPASGITGQVPDPAAAAPSLDALDPVTGATPGATATSAALPLLAAAAPLLQTECSSDALALARAALAGTGLPVPVPATPALPTSAVAGVPAMAAGVPAAVPADPTAPATAAVAGAGLPVAAPATPAIANDGLSALRLALNLAGIAATDLASGGAPCSASVADATSGTPNLAG